MLAGTVLSPTFGRPGVYARRNRKPLLTEEEQRRIDRAIDEKYYEQLDAIPSLAQQDPEKFAELKAMYEARENKEAVAMGAMCNEKGCPKEQVIGGFCTTHARRDPALSKRLDERQARKKEREKAAKSAESSRKPNTPRKQDVLADPPALPSDFDKVQNADGNKVSFGMNEISAVSFIDALDEAWQAKRAQMICALSGVDYKRSLRLQIDMLDAVDALGEWA
jgi:hypothetical protein